MSVATVSAPVDRPVLLTVETVQQTAKQYNGVLSQVGANPATVASILKLADAGVFDNETLLADIKALYAGVQVIEKASNADGIRISRMVNKHAITLQSSMLVAAFRNPAIGRAICKGE